MEICVAKIENMLAEKCITKTDYAKKCGISRQSLSVIIKKGRCEPRTAGKLAVGLGISVRDLRKE